MNNYKRLVHTELQRNLFDFVRCHRSSMNDANRFSLGIVHCILFYINFNRPSTIFINVFHNRSVLRFVRTKIMFQHRVTALRSINKRKGKHDDLLRLINSQINLMECRDSISEWLSTQRELSIFEFELRLIFQLSEARLRLSVDLTRASSGFLCVNLQNRRRKKKSLKLIFFASLM